MSAKSPPRLSSAIIPYHEIGTQGFRGHIYYGDGFEDVKIDVSSILNENETRLSVQMLEIENKMDERERAFRMEQTEHPFSSNFENGFDYLVQRLWCDLTDSSRAPQAQAHARMICERIEALRNELAKRDFQQEAKSMDIIFSGIHLLETILRRENPSRSDQDEFDLIFDGLQKRIEEAGSTIRTLDASLRTPIR